MKKLVFSLLLLAILLPATAQESGIRFSRQLGRSGSLGQKEEKDLYRLLYRMVRPCLNMA
ncbi:MAG: hypothetical protein ACLU30_10435 [Odoribacter splanchnicus]